MEVSRKGRSPLLRDCAVNWTDDMHTPFIMTRQPAPARHLKIVKRCESAHIPAVQRVSSVQLVARVFQNDQRRKGSIVASLVLSIGNTKMLDYESTRSRCR